MSVAVLGEALIDLIIGDDGAYRPHLGGSPYNVAIGLARQGVDVSYLAALSDDSFGDELCASLQREGVRLPLQRRSLWPTSLALVTVNERGQPSYRLYREGIADKDTTLEEVIAHLPPDLQVFHTGSLAITPSQLPKITALFDLLRERGVRISIDINIRLRASIDQQKYLSGVRGLLARADIVKASDEDIDAFALSENLRDAAQQLHEEMRGGLLVLTEGDGGAVLYGAPGVAAPIEKRAYPVAKVSDTVGAGDTFHSAFLANLYRAGELGADPGPDTTAMLAEALDFACAAAAINVSRAGCSPPMLAEVSSFMAATQR
ncbi:PfkB family carbohydrate kinase [Congregibacter sp.]|uniref:PfkB family carbohydrate kinase n=1 Tax=Congregibacter sp. TaxID=2744308 RepID=UPI003F6AE674